MIESIEALRTLYAAPHERALQKQLAMLEQHSKRFIELAPFVVIASCNRNGIMDASPRGGDAGFVKVLTDTSIAIPDSPGNNRLDTLTNIIETEQVGLLFMIPGIDETLRINGRARLNNDDALCRLCADQRRTPKLVIEVAIKELYLHCAKAFMRSALWDAQKHLERSALPSLGKMIGDQLGLAGPAESQEEMVARYQKSL